MKKSLYSSVVATVIPVIVGLVLGSCQQASKPSPASQVETPGLKVATPVSKADWQQEWETVLSEGKKEGAVAITTTWRPETRSVLTKAFKDKYGIVLEFSPSARGTEAMAKIQAEQRAGLYLMDVFGHGITTAVNLFKPAGLLGALEPFLILPEVKDPKYWRGGRLPFADKDKQMMALLASRQVYVIYNTDLIKKGELTSYKDVLKPQYKGKITLNDPTVTGAGAGFLTHLAFEVWNNVEEAKEFLRQLIKQQQVNLQRDNRLHVESVARGKFAIGLATSTESVAEFIKIGAPIEAVVFQPIQVSPLAGAIQVPTKLPHPNAARVFVNWLLTKEGLTLFARSFGAVSTRTDVSVEGIDPIFLFQPGDQLVWQTEEYTLNIGKMIETAKQVVEEATR